VLVALALVIAVAAAVRSTWSPCGLSMLSTITPLAERGRGHRYRSTATWFVAGAVAGGATLGLVGAGLAALVGVFDLSVAAALGVAAVLAVVAAASDLRLFGLHLPINPRQVNELWLGQFRSWVYGAGFGWQIGAGFTTYIMTGAVYLTVATAALTGRPLTAFLICVAFGTVRGLAILLGATISSPERLVAFHRRFDALAEPVRLAVIGTQLAVAMLAAAAAWSFGGTLAMAILIAAVIVASGVTRRAGDRAPAALPTT
jgi:MFS family permease